MPLIIEDCVVETSTTTGTGNFTLAGAVVGYRTFASVCATGDLIYYLIEAIDANGDRTGEWEAGLGTYSAANTLTRTTVTDSSNAGAAVNFAAGTKRVMLSLTSTQYKFRGALVKKAADQTTADYTAGAMIAWDSETGGYDTSGFHDNVTNNSRLTIPVGVNYVRLSACVELSAVTADVWITLKIYKDGAISSFIGHPTITIEAGTTTPTIEVVSPVLAVGEGNYFEAYLRIETDTSVTVISQGSWFAIEVVE